MERVPIVTRTPVVGERTPIILNQRTPIYLHPALEWDDVYNKYNNLVKFAAKQVADQNPDKPMVTAEDLYQEGLMLLWKCFDKYKYKPLEEFGYIFKASVWRLMRNQASEADQGTDDIDEAIDIGVSDSTWDDMWEDYRIKQVIELLEGHPVAIDILREFITPSQDCLRECEQDADRKDMLKKMGKRVNVPTTLEVKGIHIQRVLKLTKELYNQNMRLIQQSVYKVYSQDVEIRNYMPADDIIGAFQDSSETKEVMVTTPQMQPNEVTHLIHALTDCMETVPVEVAVG